eukprot:TRINITY_DN36064_c0_g1_i1.p1 TRINITY_DN36064_c0_g1~~TRINITY_DN36064_c0_g1_i1.p1  ORF type:complete len:849 (-),score=161.20 TRINITY_DN36064_c0_g1_i1:79-2625(-)
MEQHSLDVAVERERARRLVDRFGRNEHEGGELAREKRAHQISAEVRQEFSERRRLSSAATVEELEKALEGRRQSQIHALFHEESSSTAPQAAASAAAGGAAASTSLREGGGGLRFQPPAAPALAEAADDDAAVAAAERKSAAQELRETLDEISVKSVLDFCSAAGGVLSAEAVATAATCAIANIDDTVRFSLHSLDPASPWPGALSVLSKPGHFISSLRKFPMEVDIGRISEDNIVGARHYLAMATSRSGVNGGSLKHPAVSGLQRWVRHAIRYWEAWDIQRAPEPELATAAGGFVTHPLTASTGNLRAGPLRHEQSSAERATPSSPSTAGRPGTNVSGRAGGAAQSKRMVAPSRVMGASVTPSETGPTPSSSRSGPQVARRSGVSPRTAERGGSMAQGPSASLGSNRAGQQKASSSSTAAGTAFATKARPTSPPPQERSRPAAGGRQTTAPGRQGAGSSPLRFPTAPSATATMTPGRATSPPSRPRQVSPAPRATSPGKTAATPAAARRPAVQPAAHERRSAAGASPMRSTTTTAAPAASAPAARRQSPTRAAAAGGRSSTGSVSSAQGSTTMASSRSSGGLRAHSPNQRAAPAAPGGSIVAHGTSYAKASRPSNGTVAAYPAPPAAAAVVPQAPAINGVQPSSVEEFRKMLEETKKEVREIRAMESQMKWNIMREEKADKVLEKREAEDEIRDWRWQQRVEMKTLIEEKAAQQQRVDLQESKSFQEFKREAKVEAAQEEKRIIQEEYVQDTENATWRAEIARASLEREKEVVVERQEQIVENRNIREAVKQEEKVQVENERALEQQLEMQRLAKELERERAQLMQSLEYTRSCHQRNTRSSAASRR